MSIHAFKKPLYFIFLLVAQTVAFCVGVYYHAGAIFVKRPIMRNILQLSALSLFLSAPAMAWEHRNADFANVVQMQAANNRTEIVLSAQHECDWKHKQTYRVEKSNPNYNTFVSLATSAMMAQSKIKLFYNCDERNLPQVEIIQIRPQ